MNVELNYMKNKFFREGNNVKDMKAAEDQISLQKQTVDYNTREFTIEYIVDKYLTNIDNESNELFVPDYQREFVWDEERQSKFIESIILDLPVPLIFVAEHTSGRLEIVDGSQRIRTLSAFINDELRLKGLLKLTDLNDVIFSELIEARKRKIKNTALRMIVLSDTTTEDVRNDIFERINRGSDQLFDMEKRKGIFRGDFNDFIYNVCAKDQRFLNMAPLAPMVVKRQEHEELILRFFALYEAYPKFSFTDSMGIARYLDRYLQEANQKAKENANFIQEKKELFDKMLDFVFNTFRYGFRKGNVNQVSRVFFEAISVGTALAIKEKPNLVVPVEDTISWLQLGELQRISSGKYRTHSKPRIIERVDYVREKLLNYE